MALAKNIKTLAIFNFLTDFSLLGPVAVLYFEKVTGSYASAMSIFSLALLSSAILEVPTGILSDKLGRRKTIILWSLAGVFTSLFYALGGSYLMLALGAVMAGLARALFSGNNDAFLYDILKDEQKEKQYHEFLGKTSSLFQVALAVSSLLGGVLASLSFSLLLWLSLIPKIVKLVISFRFQEPSTEVKTETNVFVHTKEALVKFIKNPKLRLLSLASIVSYGAGEAGFQFRAAFVRQLWPLWAVGLSSTLSFMGAALSFYFSGKVIKKMKEAAVLLLGKTYGFVINVVSLAAQSVLSPALMATTSVFYGVTHVQK
jgi:MFS family permease